MPRFAQAALVALGAFLLFLIEPMAARLLLPLFGGSAAVWLTCLLFFQAALLLGYLLAHGLVSRAPPRAQGWLHAALCLLAAAALPFGLPLLSRPIERLASLPPALAVLARLALAIGPAFLALSATGPLTQARWARARPGSPYRLYALGNLASLLGLAAYPFAVEPLAPLHAQTRGFALAFAAFALLAILCARDEAGRAPAPSREDSAHEEAQRSLPAAPRAARRELALWLALPACSSALLISITGYLTRNVAPIPLLWMLPLGAYLGSFILCFELPRLPRALTASLGAASLLALARASAWIPPDRHLAWTIAGVCLLFFFACAALHAELVRVRPAPSRLTGFYLWLSLGSALGSLFAAALAPLLFRGPAEFPFALLASALALYGCLAPALRPLRFARAARTAVLLVLCVMALGLYLAAHEWAPGLVFEGRNFYAALTVQDQLSRRGPLRVLFNGTTVHGAEFMEPARLRERPAYYSPSSGVGRALTRLRADSPALRVGVIGLGAGVLAGACEPGDRFSLYELNPLVAQVAREQFHFLSGCASQRLKLGDARLTLASEPAQQFDLLVLDAFSSDSVPVHLLTREAFALYARHLAPGGILAAHLSNRYLHLAPAVAAHAAPLGMQAIDLLDDPDDSAAVFFSEWMLLSRDPAKLAGPAYQNIEIGQVVPSPREWTDDQADLARSFR